MKGCFDNINHRVLLQKLWRPGIHDKRVLKLISQMLKAGYIESDLVLYNEGRNAAGRHFIAPADQHVFE